MLRSIGQQIWKTQQWPQDWRRSAFIPIPKEGNAKECSNYRTIGLISHARKVMLKIFQTRFQQYVNHELPDVKAGFILFFILFLCFLKLVLETTEEPEIKLPASVGSLKKNESSRKTSTSALLTKTKPLTVYITKNCGKFLKRWEYQTT